MLNVVDVIKRTASRVGLRYGFQHSGSGFTGNGMSKEFTDCVVLGKDAFDPDAVFLDDIVDDEVLPYLSLAVDGLTDSGDARRGRLELRPTDLAANDVIPASTNYPSSCFDPEQLEVYGWESSWWRKLKGYIGF